jgi:hypothetical protein
VPTRALELPDRHRDVQRPMSTSDISWYAIWAVGSLNPINKWYIFHISIVYRFVLGDSHRFSTLFRFDSEFLHTRCSTIFSGLCEQSGSFVKWSWSILVRHVVGCQLL